MEITVDAKQAQAEINKTATSARTLSGTLEKLDRASMAAAKGIGAMGPAMGTLSRSSSDALRGLGDIAGLIGTGGALGLGLGVAAMAVSKLADEWTKSERAARAATEEAVRGAKAITAAIEQSIDDMKVAQTKAETGITDTAEARARMLRVEMAGLNYEIGELEKTAPKGVLSRLFSDSDNKLEAARQKAAALAAELRNIDAALSERASVALGTPKGKAAAVVPPRRSFGARAAVEPEFVPFGYGDDAALPEAAFTYSGPSPDSLQAVEDARLEIQRTAAAERVRIAKDAHDQMLRLEEKQAQDISGILVSTTAAATSAAFAAATESSSGWQDIVGAVLSSVAVQAGGVIMAKGAEVVGVGVGNGLMGNPFGALQVAGGLGLVAAGAAITAGGPSVIASVASGLSGQKVRSGGVGTGERGFGRRSRQTSGGGGASQDPVQIVNVWGVDGPQAEDQARRTVRSSRLARRRGFA